MGRPKLPEEIARKNLVKVMLNDGELELVATALTQDGLPLQVAARVALIQAAKARGQVAAGIEANNFTQSTGE